MDMNFAHKPIKRILGMMGKTPLMITKGLNTMAEATMPRKNNRDLTQMVLGSLRERWSRDFTVN